MRLSAYLFLLSFLAAHGCRSVSNDDTVYHFDSTQYQLHQSGFYISKSSDIFQLNHVAYDDSTGKWKTHYWLDSLMFYGEYPNKKPLREIIDLATFVADTGSNFERDKNHVYFARPSSDGVYRYIVEQADPTLS